MFESGAQVDCCVKDIGGEQDVDGTEVEFLLQKPALVWPEPLPLPRINRQRDDLAALRINSLPIDFNSH